MIVVNEFGSHLSLTIIEALYSHFLEHRIPKPVRVRMHPAQKYAYLSMGIQSAVMNLAPSDFSDIADTYTKYVERLHGAVIEELVDFPKSEIHFQDETETIAKIVNLSIPRGFNDEIKDEASGG